MANELQRALDLWEGGLHATGGALVPEKSHWYLVDFRWTGSNWKYLSVQDNPISIWVTDIHGNRKELKRLEIYEATTTLGVDITADGNNESQFKKMKEASIKWADQVRTGRLKRSEVSLALHSTLWRTLAYPLPCAALSKHQCEEIMAPALLQALPAMGVCRHFPRNVVHGPLSHMGLGILHIHTLQEIYRIKDMLHHSSTDTFTGQLYRGTLEAMILEVVCGANVFQFPFNDLHQLATPALVKYTWLFTSVNDITIHHDIDLPLPRTNYTPIIKLFYEKGARGEILCLLNRCRLYLKAFHLSDIVDFSGVYITESAWQGKAPTTRTNDFDWPIEGKPSDTAWTTWRTFLSQHITSRHRCLRQPLGAWLGADNWKWFLYPKEERLYEKRGEEWWYYQKVPLRTRRLSFVQGGKDSPPRNMHKAFVIQHGQ